jgi:hypothetical protein
MAALLLVTALMMSMIMAVTISNWVTVQRRGDLQMRVTMKETMLAQSAIQETRFRLSSGALSTACDPVNPQEFTYYVDRSTISIRIDCAPFP